MTLIVRRSCVPKKHWSRLSASSYYYYYFPQSVILVKGLEASTALCVTQGDISLCCRGLKTSVGGYKFRFVDEGARILAKLKRGYIYEDGEEVLRRPEKMEVSRTTRASRGEYGTAADRTGSDAKPKSLLLAPPELKVSWKGLLLLERVYCSSCKVVALILSGYRERTSTDFFS